MRCFSKGEHMGLRSGQIRIIEVAIAGIIALLLLHVVSWVAYPRVIYASYSTHSFVADNVLRVLAEKNIFCQAVYGLDGSINGNLLVTFVEGSLPPEHGFRISVSRIDDSGKMIEIFAYESGNFKLEKASSSYVILSGCNGFYEPRIVILTISRGD